MKDSMRQVRAALVLVVCFGVYTYSHTLNTGDDEGNILSTSGKSTCLARHIYLDLGANWAQTLDLYKQLLSVKHMEVEKLSRHRTGPFQIFAFEASPYIAPYVEKAIAYRNGDVSVIHEPKLPFPNSGSSIDLARINEESGNPCPTKPVDQLRRCFLARYMDDLNKLEPLRYLNSTQLINDRLGLANSKHVDNENEYVFIPAAASSVDGWLTIEQSKLGLLIGGTTTKGEAVNYTHLGDDSFPPVAVRTVDIVTWLRRSFRPCDLVLVKMDVEGAEHDIIPALIHSGAHNLVDILAWECHEKGGSCTHLRHLLQRTDIIVLEEGRDYNGW